VVALDLRGYGDSSRPASTDDEHTTYSKRVMALDAVQVMWQLGAQRFMLCAHDRGARVAHRLALDHPQTVSRMMLLDIAPTLAMYEQTSERFARAYWHWFFLIQPPPLPERLIESDPASYVTSVMGRRHAGLGVFDPLALAEYQRCVSLPGSAHAICEDYRASAGIDMEFDEADKDKKIACPLHVLYAEKGAMGRMYDVMGIWKERGTKVTGAGMPGGHDFQETHPQETLAQLLPFLAG
jgi:haloacetate dehalogenase